MHRNENCVMTHVLIFVLLLGYSSCGRVPPWLSFTSCRITSCRSGCRFKRAGCVCVVFTGIVRVSCSGRVLVMWGFLSVRTNSIKYSCKLTKSCVGGVLTRRYSSTNANSSEPVFSASAYVSTNGTSGDSLGKTKRNSKKHVGKSEIESKAIMSKFAVERAFEATNEEFMRKEPKRPRTDFMIFVEEMRTQKPFNQITNLSDLSVQVSHLWDSGLVSLEDRERYISLAEEEQKEYGEKT